MSSTSSTKRLTITDAAIERYQADPATIQLSEPGSAMVFRYSKREGRETGSFHLRHYQGGRERWVFIARWPDVPTKTARKMYATMKATLYTNPKAPAIVDRFETVGDLMGWHAKRVDRNRDLTKSRKAGVKAMTRVIKDHLASHPLQALTRHLVDDELIQPMRDIYKAQYVRATLGVLRQATKAATSINLLADDPLAGWSYKDFVTQKVQPATPKMNQTDLIPLIKSVPNEGRAALLVRLMLMWGTRIGETIAIKWAWVDMDAMMVRIPASVTKTRQQHNIPLTEQAAQMLHDWLRKQRGSLAHIFPGSRGKPIGLSIAHKDIKTISQGHWTSHDLRKLARTIWGDLGVEWMVAERMLNHAVTGLDKIYNGSQLDDQKRQAMTKYHDHLSTLNLFNQQTETVTRSAA